MFDKRVLQINKNDNVAVAIKSLKKGDRLEVAGKYLTIKEDVVQGHKFALLDIPPGAKVYKYGYPIGVASRKIKTGEWVHTHNLRTALEGKVEYIYKPDLTELDSPEQIAYFMGYRREDGQIGIRNEIWVINTVGCINKAVEKIVYQAREKFDKELNESIIDGLFSFPHPYGCSQLGDDLKNTQKVLSGLVKHPNAAGVLVVGLGCENNHIQAFKEVLGKHNEERVKFVNLQDVEDDKEALLSELEYLINYASKFKPEKFPVSNLKIGLKCGGSDSFSGITANPLVGRISDRIISYGGTAILSEVPEMFGAEEILMNRAKNEAIFSNIVQLINGFKDYYLSNGQNIYENPSPGNKEGGISTLEEKSLGNIQKGGTAVIEGVSFYGEQVKGKGLHLLESPGNDLVSTTALTVAGAQLILFTTGRGTPFGSPVPTLKISTNNRLAKRKENWIDFNAGEIIEGMSLEELSEKLFKYILKVASAEEKTKNEINGFREIAIFKNGVTL